MNNNYFGITSGKLSKVQMLTKNKNENVRQISTTLYTKHYTLNKN
jgi:hypothetical protein